MNVTEHFIKGSDNVITLTLTEAGSALSGSWSSVDVDVCDILSGQLVLNIHRTSNTAGVGFTDGVLTIKPGQLSEDLNALLVGVLYRVFVTVTIASTQPEGVDFGRGDSANALYFLVEERAA